MVVLSAALWIMKPEYKNRIKIISLYSLAGLMMLHPVFVFIILSVVGIMYYLVNKVRNEKLTLTQFTTIGLLIILNILLIGKYGNDLIGLLFTSGSIAGFNILVPLGISYFAMKIIQFVLDYRRGIIKDVEFIDILAFIVFLPTFAAGPVESYSSFKNAYISEYEQSDYIYGIKRIIIGFFKKVVITDVLITARIMPLITDYIPGNNAVLANIVPYLYVVVIFFKAYFDLSSYSDIAIGFSRLFGFKIIENFNRPFWKRNVSQFWKSWHISLSRWCTTNVYFPVFGATRKVWISMYASMIVMGMWHYVNLNWVAWALHHGSGLVFFSFFERYARKHKKLKAFMNKKPVKFFSHILTFIYVSLGYAFVGSSNFYDGVNAYVSAFAAIPNTIVEVIKALF